MWCVCVQFSNESLFNAKQKVLVREAGKIIVEVSLHIESNHPDVCYKARKSTTFFLFLFLIPYAGKKEEE